MKVYLKMNYHALAPKRYKRSVVAGFVHRIFRACSTWNLFHESLEKAKRILERNQYPPMFYDPIIKHALLDLLGMKENTSSQTEKNIREEDDVDDTVQREVYRGLC